MKKLTPAQRAPRLLTSKLCAAAIAVGALFAVATPAHAWVAGDTQTKYPIVIVPGVMGFSELFGSVEYFYKVGDGIEKYSGGQQTYNVSLSAWMSTEERGVALKREISNILKKYYRVTTLTPDHKVNIIAHSHGGTTARVAAKLMENNIASITTVSTPHYGVPLAEAASKVPKWVVDGIVAVSNLAGNALALFSGRLEWIGQQDAKGVLNDFTQAGIKEFNAKYPSAGVPVGGSYGTLQYGADTTAPGKWAGDAHGAEKSVNDPNAILFYSFAGNVGTSAITVWYDPADYILLAIRKLSDYAGFKGNADSFVPVSSAQFGKNINSSYYWNHVDEQNQILGLLAGGAADPVSVYRAHANRLKLAGR